MTETKKQTHVYKKGTIGDTINKKVSWIIEASKDIFKDKTHPFYGKTEKEIAEIFLVDYQTKKFIANEVIIEVKKYYKIKEV